MKKMQLQTEIPTPYRSLTQLYTILMKLITLLGKWSAFFSKKNTTNLFYKFIVKTDDIMFIRGSAQHLIHWQLSIIDGLYFNLSGSPLFAWCLAQNRHSYVLSKSHPALQSGQQKRLAYTQCVYLQIMYHSLYICRVVHNLYNQ